MDNLSYFILLLAAVLVILITAHAMGRLLMYFNQPRVLGEMIAGVLLGPTLVGHFFPEFSLILFRREIIPTLFSLGNLGLSIYMFLVGMEMDFRLLNPRRLKEASVLATAGMIFPILAGIVVAYFYYDQLAMRDISFSFFCLYMGTALAITAFPMLGRILQERNLMSTSFGTLSMIAACFEDVISWILLSFVLAGVVNKGPLQGVYTFIGALFFCGVVHLVVRPFLQRVCQRDEYSGHLSESSFIVIIIFLLAGSLATDLIGLYSVFGGFIIGLAVPRTPVIRTELQSKLKSVTVGVLLPLFFAFTGLNTNMLILSHLSIVFPCIVILFLAFTSKYVTGTFAMRLCGYSWRESSAVAALLNAKGLMGLVVANIGLEYNIISTDLFSILVLLSILSTIAATPIFNFSIGSENKGTKNALHSL